MNRAQSVELGVGMNAWATSQQTGLLRGIGGQLKKLESAQHEATAAQQRLADAQELQTKQLEGIQLTQQEILALQRQQLDIQMKERAERERQAALKQLVFELQMAVERIDSVDDSVARFLLFQGLHAQIRTTGLAPEQLQELADKHACHDVTAAIASRIEDATTQLSDGEQREVTAFLEQAGRYSQLRHFDHEELARLEAAIESHPMANRVSPPPPVVGPSKSAKWWLKAGAIAWVPGVLLALAADSVWAVLFVQFGILVGAPALAVRAYVLSQRARASVTLRAQWRELTESKARLEELRAAMPGFDDRDLRDPTTALPRYTVPLVEFGSRHPEVGALVSSITA